MRRGTLALGLALLTASAWGAAPRTRARALTAAEEKEVAALRVRQDRHAAAREFEQAAKVAERIAAYRRQRQGASHWQAIDARFEVEVWRRLAAVPAKDRAEVLRGFRLNGEGVALLNGGRYGEAEKPLRQALAIYQEAHGEQHPDTADSYNNVASSLEYQGKSAEALPLYRKALAIHQKVLGEHHPQTAASYNNVAYCLESQGKYVEALPLHRKALAIRLKAHGRQHPLTADSYTNLASCLNSQGKSAEALPLFREALAIHLKVQGGQHPDTATGYNNVGTCLNAQGKYAEALPLFRQALAIYQKVLGEHPNTALGYNNVASCLTRQEKYGEALPLHRKALAIRLKVHGEQHPHTAGSYDNLAGCLNGQGKAAEALPLYRKALAIHQKVLGEHHPNTALGYNNVGLCLNSQGKYGEALPLFREALAVYQKVHGEEHPDTALGYNNVAACLDSQGKFAEALPLHRKALAISLKVHGEQHPATATSFNNLALCLWDQKEHGRAARLWQRSLPAQEVARLHTAPSGFDRAQAGARHVSPNVLLAVALARLGQSANAFRHAEAGLARGLLDDLSARSREENDRVRDLLADLAALEPVLASLAGRERLSDEQKARYEQARREHGRFSAQLSELLSAGSARQVLPLSRIQQSIPADAALVLWIDVSVLNERWGCVVRRQGKPIWQPLKGSGKEGEWTADDANLPDRLHQALLDPATSDAARRKLLDAFARQRLDPLRRHLKGVKRLFVVPTGALARVPADLLDDRLAVRYVPSGSMLARLRENHRAVEGSSLLAVGDPIFDREPPPDPPASGLLVKSVLPGGHAAKAGLRPGDVLLAIGATRLDSFDELQGALSDLPAKATVWRDGKQFTARLAGSPLGAAFDQRSARAAVRAWRRDHEALAQRGTGHKRLPGTRLEVEVIASLVKGSKTLLGGDASEQKLDALIDAGKLKGYRLLHLATHGEADDQRPGRSALILAQDNLPDPLAQVNAGRHPYDGRLTVARIRQRWQLDADLVVLSACETGLGKDAGGDGLLGFAQAFLSKGARSVMLSRWKVDDTATSLLMVRLYENLLGKRAGLKKGMGRAAALDEAKKWLRTLPRKEAERLATLQSGGVLRGSEGVEKAPSKAKPVQLKGDKPFAHPYYWAAFTLVGDPD